MFTKYCGKLADLGLLDDNWNVATINHLVYLCDRDVDKLEYLKQRFEYISMDFAYELEGWENIELDDEDNKLHSLMYSIRKTLSYLTNISQNKERWDLAYYVSANREFIKKLQLVDSNISYHKLIELGFNRTKNQSEIKNLQINEDCSMSLSISKGKIISTFYIKKNSFYEGFESTKMNPIKSLSELVNLIETLKNIFTPIKK